jgi:hypothetical protein
MLGRCIRRRYYCDIFLITPIGAARFFAHGATLANVTGGRAFGFAFALLGAGGCSLLVSVDGLSGGVSDSGDASPGDANPQSDAASGNVDAGPNLIFNGDFEEAGADCEDWFTFNATATTDPIAHSGQSSCRVCEVGASGFALDHNTILSNISPGSTFTGTAWVRATPSNTDPAQHVAVAFRVYADAGGAPLQDVGSASPVINQSWVQLTVMITTTSGGNLNLFIPADQTVDGSCFLVDDVVAFENL